MTLAASTCISTLAALVQNTIGLKLPTALGASTASIYVTPYQHRANDVSYSQGHDRRPLNPDRGLGPSAQMRSAESDEWMNGDGNASIGMGDIVVQRGWDVYHGV